MSCVAAAASVQAAGKVLMSMMDRYAPLLVVYCAEKAVFSSSAVAMVENVGG